MIRVTDENGRLVTIKAPNVYGVDGSVPGRRGVQISFYKGPDVVLRGTQASRFVRWWLEQIRKSSRR